LIIPTPSLPLPRHQGGNPAPNVAPRILLVDDDVELRQLIAIYLAKNDLSIAEASDGVEMDRALGREPFDLVILDMMMPGEDGLAILRRMRGHARPPIIMLSAMGEDSDRIIGLEVGADDYVAKPCNPRELLARIRAVLRRGAPARAADTAQRRRFGCWTLDINMRELCRDDEPPARLTDAEFRALTAFLDRPQRLLTRDQLIEASRSIDSEVLDRAIDVTVFRLRKKFGPDGPIRTMRGEGYMFTLKATFA
jgi:two-component system OmpR family response regulator